jgi:hypothetical protein
MEHKYFRFFFGPVYDCTLLRELVMPQLCDDHGIYVYIIIFCELCFIFGTSYPVQIGKIIDNICGHVHAGH